MTKQVLDTVDDLLTYLAEVKETHGGNISVRIDSLSHSWRADPELRDRAGKKVLVLNA